MWSSLAHLGHGKVRSSNFSDRQKTKKIMELVINHRKCLSLYYVPLTHLQQLVNKMFVYPYKEIDIDRQAKSEGGEKKKEPNN